MIDFALCSQPTKQQIATKCDKESVSRPITAAAGRRFTSNPIAGGLNPAAAPSPNPSSFSANVLHEASSDSNRPKGCRCSREQKVEVSIPSNIILSADASWWVTARINEL
jgi:hypothetical protein